MRAIAQAPRPRRYSLTNTQHRHQPAAHPPCVSIFMFAGSENEQHWMSTPEEKDDDTTKSPSSSSELIMGQVTSFDGGTRLSSSEHCDPSIGSEGGIAARRYRQSQYTPPHRVGWPQGTHHPTKWYLAPTQPPLGDGTPCIQNVVPSSKSQGCNWPKWPTTTDKEKLGKLCWTHHVNISPCP